jgi:hypothetical protein
MTVSTDVWFLILQYISVTDNLKLQTVSKEWKYVLKYLLSQRVHLRISCENGWQRISTCKYLVRKCPKLEVFYCDVKKFTTNVGYVMPAPWTIYLTKKCPLMKKLFVHKMGTKNAFILLNNLPNLQLLMCNEITNNDGENALNVLTNPIVKYKRYKMDCWVYEIPQIDPLIEKLKFSDEFLIQTFAFLQIFCSNHFVNLKKLVVHVDINLLSDICNISSQLESLVIKISHRDTTYGYGSIGHFKQLQYLDLQAETHGEEIIYLFSTHLIFQNCKKLKTIKMAGVKLKPKAIEYMSLLENLKTVRFYKCIIETSPQQLKQLAKLTNLEYFDFHGTLPGDSDACLSYFFEKCTNLNAFHIYNNCENVKNIVGQCLYEKCLERATTNSSKSFNLEVWNYEICHRTPPPNCHVVLDYFTRLDILRNATPRQSLSFYMRELVRCRFKVW